MATAEAGACRVLVAEDDPANAHLFRQVLAAEGHDVRLAADGVEALERVAEWPPDLILLDLDMPRLSGYEVCRRVKQAPATRFIPVVIVTAEEGFAAKLRAWELGADDFLSKPLHCVELVARSRSLLRLKRLIDELDTAEAVVFALARTVEAKSPYTQGHAQRVTHYALALADALGLAPDERELLRKGALLHDNRQDQRPRRRPRQARPVDRRRVRGGQGPRGAGGAHRRAAALAARRRPADPLAPRAPRRPRLPGRARRRRHPAAGAGPGRRRRL
jgi:CheY-like chemotaxis protein